MTTCCRICKAPVRAYTPTGAPPNVLLAEWHEDDSQNQCDGSYRQVES